GLDDVLHHLVRVAPERIELEPGLLDHRPELAVRRDAHAVTLREATADGNEGLNVAARAHHHDHDGHGRGRRRFGGRAGSGLDLAGVRGKPGGSVSEAARGVVEVDLERAPRSRRDGRDPAHRRRTQASTVEAPSQERGGEGIHETLFPGFSHLAAPSASRAPAERSAAQGRRMPRGAGGAPPWLRPPSTKTRPRTPSSSWFVY